MNIVREIMYFAKRRRVLWDVVTLLSIICYVPVLYCFVLGFTILFGKSVLSLLFLIGMSVVMVVVTFAMFILCAACLAQCKNYGVICNDCNGVLKFEKENGIDRDLKYWATRFACACVCYEAWRNIDFVSSWRFEQDHDDIEVEFSKVKRHNCIEMTVCVDDCQYKYNITINNWHKFLMDVGTKMSEISDGKLMYCCGDCSKLF